jgi:hypothetical protein
MREGEEEKETIALLRRPYYSIAIHTPLQQLLYTPPKS